MRARRPPSAPPHELVEAKETRLLSAVMREGLRRRGAIAPVLICVMLASLALSQTVATVSGTIGIDFYQFWGVPVAMRVSGHVLGPPYTDGRRYQQVLEAHAAGANQPALRAAQRFWSGPDFAGSPLLYVAFTPVSNDYALSLRLFQMLQVLAFLGACLFLGHLYRLDPFSSVCFALVGLLFYQPLLSDLRVANLGCVQLAILAASLGLASTLPRVTSFARRAALAALLLVVVVVLTLCKPNIVLVGAFLSLHLARRHGPRLFVVAAVPALLAAAVAFVVPCLYFGTWTVWGQWYHFVYGANPRMLVRPIANGNYSTPLLLSSWFGGNVSTIAGVLFVLLGVSLALVVKRRRETTASRAAWAFVRGVVARCVDDPRAALALPIVLTIGTSPLSWVHYDVLLLIPSLWLLTLASAPTVVGALAFLSVVMSAGLAGLALWALGWTDAMPSTITLSWVPLWAALVIALRGSDADVPRTATSAPGTPRSRRPRT